MNNNKFIYPTINVEKTGERLKELRKIKGISVKELASYMGFACEQTIYKWERAESLPSIDSLFALSKLFETPMDDILR